MTVPKPIPPASMPLIARLAARVRAARAAKGLPRRALSERSGVSPRYLAQLEAGEGNISVVLLGRVAEALEVRIEDLLREDEPLHPDVARVARLYQAATPATQGRVRSLLAPQNPAALRAQRICLIGLRGAGKSTLGELAARKLNIPFLELNKAVEERTGMPIAEVMGLYGIDGYRKLETEALDDIIHTHDKIILAVAGGIVSNDETYTRLLERFHTVWVRTSPAEHMARVRAQGDLRPMEGKPDAMNQLKELLNDRRREYERALAQVDTTSKPVSSSVNDLLTIIAKHRFLDAIAAE